MNEFEAVGLYFGIPVLFFIMSLIVASEIEAKRNGVGK
jgi:hypothetical protein